MRKDKRVFRLDGFERWAKDLDISCADGDLRLSVDYDDVNHYEAAALLRKALRILNDHWHDAEYADAGPAPIPKGVGEEEIDNLWDQRYKEAGEIMESLV